MQARVIKAAGGAHDSSFRCDDNPEGVVPER